MKNYIIVSEKSWNADLVNRLKSTIKANWILIDSKENFIFENIKEINPTFIFIPHWSYLIPETIFNNFECVVFHMTDLPYGRGGSPLQNLIIRGHITTKISAIQVVKEIDAGPIYLKKDLDLSGNATEVFKRADEIVELMINEIIINSPTPQEQTGEIIEFKRRKPEDGNLSNLILLNEFYDYIRMLDAASYPPAFIETKGFKIEFTNAQLKEDHIKANVRISKK